MNEEEEEKERFLSTPTAAEPGDNPLLL